jgi:excisionase family DNA binding protein
MPDPTADQPADLFAISEAAELLRAPVATLRYWRHLGSGPHSFRLGRRVLYRRDDLHAWIDAQRDGSESNGLRYPGQRP